MTSSIIAKTPMLSLYHNAELVVSTAAVDGAIIFLILTIRGQADGKRDDERTVALAPDQIGRYEGPTR